MDGKIRMYENIKNKECLKQFQKPKLIHINNFGLMQFKFDALGNGPADDVYNSNPGGNQNLPSPPESTSDWLHLNNEGYRHLQIGQ